MNNTGTVNIIREKRFLGAIVNFEIYIDSKPVGLLKNGCSISIPINYGNHIVSLKTVDKNIDYEILISNTNKNCYIKCNCKMGLITGRAHITKVYYE